MRRSSFCLALVAFLAHLSVEARAQDVEEDEHELSADHWLTEEERVAADAEGDAEPPMLETIEEPDPTPMPDPPRPPTCGRQAREAAASAVVRIRTGGNWGAGFVYHSPRHVVTAWSLMSLGRPVTVVARDGTHLEARLLGKDEELDIAVLVVDRDVPGASPLIPAPETSVEIGATVVALGHPFAGAAALLGDRGRGLLRWSVSQGTIGALNEVGVQADVALAVGNAGGPLLDCGGHVLGMVAGTGLLSADLGLIARIGRVDDLIEVAGEPSDFLGDMDLHLGVGAGLAIDEEGRAAGGFYIALAAVLFDRIQWMNRVGFFNGGIDSPSVTELEVSRNLLRIESLLGYRIFIDIGGFTELYIVPAIGLTVSYETISRSTASVVPVADPACMTSATESCVMPSVTRTSAENWLVRPAIGLTFFLGSNFGIGYSLELGLNTADEQASAAARGVMTDEVETYHTVRIELLL